jgi:hypothetical protein
MMAETLHDNGMSPGDRKSAERVHSCVFFVNIMTPYRVGAEKGIEYGLLCDTRSMRYRRVVRLCRYEYSLGSAGRAQTNTGQARVETKRATISVEQCPSFQFCVA